MLMVMGLLFFISRTTATLQTKKCITSCRKRGRILEGSPNPPDPESPDPDRREEEDSAQFPRRKQQEREPNRTRTGLK